MLAEIKTCDVLLKGPTTTPKGGGAMESANVALRRELDLYANVRPVCRPGQKSIDWIFYRENTEGEYVLGSRGVEAARHWPWTSRSQPTPAPAASPALPLTYAAATTARPTSPSSPRPIS